MNHREIVISNACTLYLKNISLRLPSGKTTVVTGISGSGKTSLLRHTLLAESQRRFAQGMGHTGLVKFKAVASLPHEIGNLPPMVDVSSAVRPNSHTTLAWMTGIHQILQTLFSNDGTAACDRCQHPLNANSASQIVRKLKDQPHRTKIIVLAPLVGKTAATAKEMISQAGYVRVRYGKDLLDLTDFQLPSDSIAEDLAVVIDRIILKEGVENRLRESIESAYRLSRGVVLLSIENNGVWQDFTFTEKLFCTQCQKKFPDLSPALFSYYSAQGGCETCAGKGFTRIGSGRSAVVSACQTCHGARLNLFSRSITYEGKTITEILGKSVSEACDLFKEWDAIFGSKTYLADNDAHAILRSKLHKKLVQHGRKLCEIGLDYLHLNRTTGSLSTGEYQRGLLTRGLAGDLSEVAYVIEEPTAGLHERDIPMLIKSLVTARQNGNTLIIADHHPQILELSDRVIEMGPGSGARGGDIIFEGTPQQFEHAETATAIWYQSNKNSNDNKTRDAYPHNQNVNANQCLPESLVLKGAALHNLKQVTLNIPCSKWTAVTGVSGSGKSSLVFQCLLPAVQHKLNSRGKKPESKGGNLTQLGNIKRVVSLNQQDMMRGRSQLVISALGIWNLLRKIYCHTKYAKLRGWTPRDLSFANSQFACQNCTGKSMKKIAMEISTSCDTCKGERIIEDFKRLKLKQVSIARLLKLTVHEALKAFESFARIVAPLTMLCELGLSELQLGRVTGTLSHGELSRIHLSRELAVSLESPTLFLLDEPSFGLHPVERIQLVAILKKIVSQGHTVVCIEHRNELIHAADYQIMIGPGAGEKGGEIVSQSSCEKR